MVAGGEQEHGQEQAWDASPLGQLGGNPSLHAVPDGIGGISNPSTQPTSTTPAPRTQVTSADDHADQNHPGMMMTRPRPARACW